MKRKVLLLAISLMLVATGVVSAASNWGKFEGYNIVRLVIDGKTVSVNDTPPVILKGRTMVPISMLEQAGVTAKWDPKTYTVDVSSSLNISDRESLMRKYFVIIDFYKQLDDLGDSIYTMDKSLNTAYSGVTSFNTRSSLDSNYKYLSNKIDQYNYYVDEFELSKSEFANWGVNVSDMSLVLDNYYKTIDYYKESFEHLEKIWSNANDDTAHDNFFKSLKNASDKVYSGIEKSSDGYNKYKELMFEL
jgi:hypothetical protein